jgi:phospholipid transport system substrate-binding protein
MKLFRPSLALLSAMMLATPVALTAAASPAGAAAINNQDPSQFIETLSKFRTLLAQHFAVDAIGDRLIRRWNGQVTPAQKAAYKAAFPDYIIGTYADRLFEYANADLKVVRTTPVGSGIDVTTQVVKPGQQPVTAVWSVAKAGSGYKVTNLKVAGVNLAIAQSADFDAIIQRKGFDALVAMMKARS